MSRNLIQVVEAVKATRRKPEEYETLTFFSRFDVWQMHMVFDTRTCKKCAKHVGSYRGNQLRLLFPNLEIIDVDMIYANVHPHCRCYLLRTYRKWEIKND